MLTEPATTLASAAFAVPKLEAALPARLMVVNVALLLNTVTTMR
jgi:hypothetical protein